MKPSCAATQKNKINIAHDSFITIKKQIILMKKLWPLLLLFIAACGQKEQKKAYNADLLIKNAVIYTVDSSFSTAQCLVVNAGKIIAVGDSSLQSKYIAHEVVDAGGHAIYPGFIDAHA